jgi:protein gp37
MSDLFHENVKDEWIDKIFAVMALCPQHTFQILTKRPKRMRDYLNFAQGKPLVQRWANSVASLLKEDSEKLQFKIVKNKHYGKKEESYLKNVWLGTSIENQPAAEERIGFLLQIQAAVLFLSCEPLLGNVDLTTIITYDGNLIRRGYDPLRGEDFAENFTKENKWEHRRIWSTQNLPKIDWVIVGGESGNKARPCSFHWIRSIVRQCKAAKVPVFVKQLGSNPIWGSGQEPLIQLVVKNRKGGDMQEFPKDLRVREMPR